ncbi:hypothetical protein [Leisingera sp. ANG-Vp]|uniref:hypothetical protein n=1 Tax=Leisingera sp. ANG-Vp TaxID=1577896 RepID=UPI00057FD21E|nr:hypothetical protein [Leisingera sp. ANG-Vp]KIC20884.1 hypothetical protein RA20_06315 [Leisingera sp. ANG-Vp]
MKLFFKTCTVFAAALTLLLFAPPGAAGENSSLPNVRAEIFSPERVRTYGKEQYSIGPDGSLLGGYKASRKQPVDYSALLSNETLIRDFLKSVQGCIECGSIPFSWPDTGLTFHVHTAAEAKTPHLIFKGGEELYDVFSEALIDSTPEKRQDMANMVVFAGDAEFLARKAQQAGAANAAAFFSNGKRATARPGSTEDLLDRLFSGTNCTVSLKDRASKGRSYVFTTLEDLDACLSRQFLLVAGLLPFEGDTPSALNLNFNYTKATLADVAFLRIHYYIRKTPSLARLKLQTAAAKMFDLYDFGKRMH